MFDRISGRYDFLNRFLSFRRDIAWRKTASRYAGPAERVLDLCGGTGDFILTWMRLWGRPQKGLVADFSMNMLRRGRLKRGCPPLIQCDALAIPMGKSSVDLVMCGFGMRNLDDLDRGLAEVRRVLSTGGNFVVLEFFKPGNPWTRFFYGVLAPVFIPVVGALFSGRREAYEYLVNSVKRFVSPQEFSERARRHGLETHACVALDGGIAHMILLSVEDPQ